MLALPLSHSLPFNLVFSFLGLSWTLFYSCLFPFQLLLDHLPSLLPKTHTQTVIKFVYVIIIIIIIHLFYIVLFRYSKTLYRLKKKYKNNTHEIEKKKRTGYTLKTILKRWDLVSVFKVLSSAQSLMCLGIVFQREGAATEKALSPQVQCLVLWGGVRRFASEEQRVRDGLWQWSRSIR